jgi:hypothetical protein
MIFLDFVKSRYSKYKQYTTYFNDSSNLLRGVLRCDIWQLVCLFVAV